jgi:glycosyltransferase involved in cell wall biosynthesis
MNLVTVVIPAYNAEPYIERTLLSVMAQSHNELEIIVINDGSTDKTAQIIERLARDDPRIRMLSIPNGGVARARNIGIREASAEFIAFIDADDLWHREKIELQLTFLIENGCDYGGCFTLFRSIDLDDRVTYNGWTKVVSGYIYTRHLCFHFVGNGSSLLVRRSAAQAIGGFDPSYADSGIGGCEDLDFELRLAANFKIHGLPLYLVGYRRYEGNMSSDRIRMSRSMNETVDRHLLCAPALPPRVKSYARAAALDYTTWVMLRDKRVFRALFALSRLSFHDAKRGAMTVQTLAARVSERLPFKNRKSHAETANKRFHDLPIEPESHEGDSPWDARLDELATIDSRIWNAIAQRRPGDLVVGSSPPGEANANRFD